MLRPLYLGTPVLRTDSIAPPQSCSICNLASYHLDADFLTPLSPPIYARPSSVLGGTPDMIHLHPVSRMCSCSMGGVVDSTKMLSKNGSSWRGCFCFCSYFLIFLLPASFPYDLPLLLSDTIRTWPPLYWTFHDREPSQLLVEVNILLERPDHIGWAVTIYMLWIYKVARVISLTAVRLLTGAEANKYKSGAHKEWYKVDDDRKHCEQTKKNHDCAQHRFTV